MRRRYCNVLLPPYHNGERLPCISARKRNEPIAGGIIDHDRCARDDTSHVFFGKLFEHEHPATREERRDDLKARVLRRSSDQGELAAFYEGQEIVLLRLIETMDLIEKKDLMPVI